jgi:hypothetical protein
MITKAPKPQTQNGYRRVESNLHVHISARKLRIMHFLEKNKLRVTLKMLQTYIYELIYKSTLL